MSPTVAKLNKEVNNLQEELRILRSFVIGIINKDDKEGEYKSEFVEEILNTSKQEGKLLNKDVFFKMIQN